MGLVSKTHTAVSGQAIPSAGTNSNLDTLYSLVNGNIDSANMSPTAALPDTMLNQITTASKVHGTSITGLASLPAGAGVIPAANLPAGNVSPTHYRSEMFVTQASTTTMTVGLGVVDVNARIEKTTETTLTISTAGNWAGGVSLRAVSTYGYVGIDTAGNIKMHTTAPSHSDYAVSNTSGKKRYATWSGTVYRIIGWFYMNATGSGELLANEVGNIREGNAPNSTYLANNTSDTLNDVAYGTDITGQIQHFYASGGPVHIHAKASALSVGGGGRIDFIIDIDTTDKAESTASANVNDGADPVNNIVSTMYQETLSQGVHTITVQGQIAANSATITRKGLWVNEL